MRQGQSLVKEVRGGWVLPFISMVKVCNDNGSRCCVLSKCECSEGSCCPRFFVNPPFPRQSRRKNRPDGGCGSRSPCLAVLCVSLCVSDTWFVLGLSVLKLLRALIASTKSAKVKAANKQSQIFRNFSQDTMYRSTYSVEK